MVEIESTNVLSVAAERALATEHADESFFLFNTTCNHPFRSAPTTTERPILPFEMGDTTMLSANLFHSVIITYRVKPDIF